MSDDEQQIDDGEPPWGGWGKREYRPDLLPPVDPAEFRRIVMACVPKEWPEEFPAYVSEPLFAKFHDELYKLAHGNHLLFVPIYQRFLALLRLLEGGELGPGWPSQRELLEGHETLTLHPAIVHTASQLPLSPDGRFDPVEFRREALRTAKRTGLALPPGLLEG